MGDNLLTCGGLLLIKLIVLKHGTFRGQVESA